MQEYLKINKQSPLLSNNKYTYLMVAQITPQALLVSQQNIIKRVNNYLKLEDFKTHSGEYLKLMIFRFSLDLN